MAEDASHFGRLLPPRLLFFFISLLIRLSSSSDQGPSSLSSPTGTLSLEATETTTPSSLVHEQSRTRRIMKGDLMVVFSDIDGTLVHYPANADSVSIEEGNEIIHLPPSATGSMGILSAKTLRECREIRRRNVKLVLVSGMRTSTLLKRLPYLPKADAYCSEGGGRIFYPSSQGFLVVPVLFDGATEEDLTSFCITEDQEWRQRIEEVIGRDGYLGNEIGRDGEDEEIPVVKRSGSLWKFANRLSNEGYVLDTKGYAACFRVNRKQQTSSSISFDNLLTGGLETPTELGSSINLGCIDFYPAISGKKNCCLYLAEKFCGSSDSLSQHCVCLCDDDNDLEMALACAHAFIPSISSESMAKLVETNKDQFTKTFGEEIKGTTATEAALAHVLTLTQDTVISR